MHSPHTRLPLIHQNTQVPLGPDIQHLNTSSHTLAYDFKLPMHHLYALKCLTQIRKYGVYLLMGGEHITISLEPYRVDSDVVITHCTRNRANHLPSVMASAVSTTN